MVTESEKDIIRFFQACELESIACITGSKLEERVLSAVHDLKKWRRWTDASAKDAPPPDFYSDKMRLMMDVMKVEDHSHISQKGKLINPNAERERRMYNELKSMGILDQFPKASVICNAITDLPTNEDHQFMWYCENFKRVIEEHNRKVPLYLQNHPGYKTVFLIFDESTAYIQQPRICSPDQLLMNQLDQGLNPHSKFHVYAHDEFFQTIIKNMDADVIIWYAPYKYPRNIAVKVPALYAAAVIDVRSLRSNRHSAVVYSAKDMVSTES